MKKKVIVIGSGFGGLGAAARLAARGFDIEVFEQRDKPGGRGYQYEINGFKFDGGPTVITAPFMFDDIFAVGGKKTEEYFKLLPVNPFYRIFDHTGFSFDYNNDKAAMLAQIEKLNPRDVEGYQRFITTTRAIFEKGFLQLSDKPFLHVTDMLKVAPDLIRLQSYLSVYGYVSQFIENDFLRQICSFHPLLVGGNPFDTTSIYTLIHYLEREWGVHYAVGGTGAIVNGLVKFIQENNGKVHFNTPVKEILVENRKVTGILLNDGTVNKADMIISNADVASTYRYLIPEQYRKVFRNGRINSYKYSMSLFVIYFGTKRLYRDTKLAHHNIILSDRYKPLLEDIFNKRVLADDFSLYLHMPTLTDPSIAPEGMENFYVLSPVPHLDADIDWKTMAIPYKNKILQFLEENYIPGLRENIVAEHYIDPLHFRDVLGSYKGAAFSVQPILTQSAWFRPHNQSEEFDNLFFVGAGTHPGAGVPGVLSSSKIVDDLISNQA